MMVCVCIVRHSLLHSRKLRLDSRLGDTCASPEAELRSSFGTHVVPEGPQRVTALPLDDPFLAARERVLPSTTAATTRLGALARGGISARSVLVVLKCRLMRRGVDACSARCPPQPRERRCGYGHSETCI